MLVVDNDELKYSMCRRVFVVFTQYHLRYHQITLISALWLLRVRASIYMCVMYEGYTGILQLFRRCLIQAPQSIAPSEILYFNCQHWIISCGKKLSGSRWL